MKQRVLVLTGESPDVPGGMEHAIRELVEGMERRGYAVEVLHRHNSSNGWVARPVSKWQTYAADCLLSWYLGRAVARRRGDDLAAVVSNGPFGWHLPSLPARVRKIHFYHGTYRGQAEQIQSFTSLAGRLKLKWWDCMVLERFSGWGKRILCNSEQTRQEVRNFFGYEGSTVWVPLDTGHFRTHDKTFSRCSLGLPENAKIGLFVGSAQPTKGISVVRALVDRFTDVKWVLAIRGDVPNAFNQENHVKILKNASADILPALYNAADFAVCPSRYEAFGYVVAEALSCGTPVIASPGGASSYFLSRPPLNQLLVSGPEAFEEFATAVNKVLADPDLYRQSVVEQVRPEIERIMGRENWWNHFFELTGL